MLNLIIPMITYGEKSHINAPAAASGIVKIHMVKISEINPVFPSPPARSTAIIPVISIPENGQIAAKIAINPFANALVASVSD